MNVETYRLALKDSSHPFYEATWLIFAEQMNTKFAAKRLTAQKDDLIPYLLEIVDDESLAEEGSLGKGFAPPHAIDLLGEWGVTEALPRLIKILEEEDEDTYIWGSAADALGKMGPEVVDEMFALLDRSEDVHVATVGGILSSAGKGNQRVYDWLKSQLDLHKEDWKVRWWVECLLECDKEQASSLLEERIQKRKYSPQLRAVFQKWIDEARQE